MRNFRLFTYNVPSGSSATSLTTSAKRELWRDGTDRRPVNNSVLQFSSYLLGIQIMYISTYIRNQNCHQHSYGFQNFMSSWGSWSKISKLQQVGDVSFFRSKSSLFIFTNTWEAFFCEKIPILYKMLHVTLLCPLPYSISSGYSKSLMASAKRELLKICGIML